MSPQEEFAIGMDLLHVRESLEESLAELLLPQRRHFLGGDLVVAEEAGHDLLPLRRQEELLPEAVSGGDDVSGGGGRGGDCIADTIAAAGEGSNLRFDAVQGGECGVGGCEEIQVDRKGALLDGGSEVAACLGSVVGVEVGEGLERRYQIRRLRSR